MILNHHLWVTLIFHMNESNKNRQDQPMLYQQTGAVKKSNLTCQ